MLFLGVYECGVDFNMRPAQYRVPEPAHSSGAAHGAGRDAWLVTPDVNLLGLSLPGWTIDIIAYFLSPYGHDLDADPGCEFVDINPF